MQELPPVGGGDDDRHLFQKLLGYFDAPAFIRRVKRLEEAERILAEHLRHRRTQGLSMVRLRLGQLRALAGDWDALRPLLASDEALAQLSALHDELRPELRLPLEVTESRRALRGALIELAEAVEAFNRRWHKYLAEFDLAPLNELRDGYNKHYVLEKECALGSGPVARMGFRRLDPLTNADLVRQFPPLPPIPILHAV